MNALPTNVVEFTLPKKPRVKQKDAPPDQRKLAVIPIRAGTDERLHGGTLRALIVLCSFCNRAGLTWVSQKKLAETLKISQQAVSKQFKLLVKTGYVEVVRKGFRGERSTTVRVIFDESIKTEDAIALTSSIEDTRTPAIKREQEMQMQEEIDRAGQAKIAKMIAQALKNNQPRKEPPMATKEDSLTVKKMKAEIAKKKQPKGTHSQPPEVVQQAVSEVVKEASHSQPGDTNLTTSEGCVERKNKVFKDSIKESKVKKELNNKSPYGVLNNFEVEELKAQGLTDAKIAEALDVLLPAYKAEGLNPTSRLLVDSILQLNRDVR